MKKIFMFILLIHLIFICESIYSQELENTEDLKNEKDYIQITQQNDLNDPLFNVEDDLINNETAQESKSFFDLLYKINWSFLISVGVPLLILVVTNSVQLKKIYLESKENIKRNLYFESLNIRRNQLSKFYDPIIALLKTNTSIFNAFGPKSFPSENIKGEEAKDIWNHLVDVIIIKNNDEIINLIKNNSHQVDIKDSVEEYYCYMRHAISYKAFRFKRNELHQKFPYPDDFLDNVEKHRKQIYNGIKNDEALLINSWRK